ncbi:MAG: AsmA family protein [Deltaproteobacteria bacterium]|nr:AsmA family protein [Deltaproteobacteria bacterium]
MLVVFALILVLVIFTKAVNKPQIEAAASSVLGMDVRVNGRMGIVVSPAFGVSLENVSVRNGESRVATVEKMRIGLKLIPLMRREAAITQAEIIKPVFSLVRSKEGTFNFEKPGHTRSEKSFAVKRISISQGNLVYTDEQSGATIEAGEFDSTLRNLSSSGTDSAERFQKISFTGDSRCKTLKINNLPLTNVVLRITAKNGIFDIDPISMNLFGGTGNGSIHVDMTGAAPDYWVVYVLNQFRIEELLQAYSLEKPPQNIMEGPTNLSADLTARGKNADELKRSLNGDLSLSGENLMLNNIDIDALVAKYERSQNFNLVDVGAFFLAGPFGPVLTKGYNFASLYEEAQGGEGIIRQLVSVWKVKDGIAEATDVALATKKYRIAMKGGLNFITERFDDVTVAVLDKRGCAVYSEKVQGPFREPQVEKVNIFESIAGPVLNVLNDAWELFQSKEGKVFYSGSVAQPEG